MQERGKTAQGHAWIKRGRCTPESPLAAPLATSSAFSLSPRLRQTSHTLTAASWPALARYFPFLLNFIVQITPAQRTNSQGHTQEPSCCQASATAQNLSKQLHGSSRGSSKKVGSELGVRALPLCALSSWMTQRCVSSLTSLECASTFTGLSGPRPEGEAGPLSNRLKDDPVSIVCTSHACRSANRQADPGKVWDEQR